MLIKWYHVEALTLVCREGKLCHAIASKSKGLFRRNVANVTGPPVTRVDRYPFQRNYALSSELNAALQVEMLKWFKPT